ERASKASSGAFPLPFRPQSEPSLAGLRKPSVAEPSGLPLRFVATNERPRLLDVLAARGTREGESDRTARQVDEAATVRRDIVVLPLRRRVRDDLDLAVRETEAPIKRSGVLRVGLRVRKEDLRRTRFDDDVSLGAPDHFADRLAGEHNRGILLPEGP